VLNEYKQLDKLDQVYILQKYSLSMVKIKKDVALGMLEQGLSFEEIPNFSNINDLENLVDESDLDKEIKLKVRKKLLKLKTESANHSKMINELMIYLLRSKANEF
jgi:hypothetical protein